MEGETAKPGNGVEQVTYRQRIRTQRHHSIRLLKVHKSSAKREPNFDVLDGAFLQVAHSVIAVGDARP